MKNSTENIRLNLLKKIILFALLNSSFFIAFGGSGFLRLCATILMNISGLLLIYTYSIDYKLFKTLKISSYFRVLFSLLVLWSLVTIIKSISFDETSLKSLFGHPLMGWTWLTPLAIVFGFKISNWVFIFNYFNKLLLISSILTLGSLFYNQKIIFGLLEWMAFLPILLLTYSYQNKKNKNIILLATICYILLSLLVSQRSNIIFMSIIGFFFILHLYRNTILSFLKFGLSLFLIISCLVLLVNGKKYYNEINNNEDLTRDTRTFLYEEILEDMQGNDLIYGRGALGKYYSPFFESWNKSFDGGDSEFRSVNEVGYLQIILKGGTLLLILYLLILIPAAYLGIFKSNNIIAKMSGLLILSYLFLWTISYYPIYSAEYILLWMAVGTTISVRTRRITDIGIKKLVLKNRNR